ncbi:hypothetical protein CYMTET_40531 [Cymbomonas tetramitiformis]|uniref:Uncharacterized protein n=1 Tax=Cymbomonas tetramitiformis TaxID=36881 RepID=A0AAE0CA45_9CHLO|nr:hypothetical protein CYMTET_40531 [Cymbomonas tetramitiformis]
MRSDDLDLHSSTPSHYSQLRKSDIPRTGGSSIKNGIFQRTPSSSKPTVAWADSRQPDAAQHQSAASTTSPHPDGPHAWGDDTEGEGEEEDGSDEPEYDSERWGSEDEPSAANGTGAFRVSHRITSNHGEG